MEFFNKNKFIRVNLKKAFLTVFLVILAKISCTFTCAQTLYNIRFMQNGDASNIIIGGKHFNIPQKYFTSTNLIGIKNDPIIDFNLTYPDLQPKDTNGNANIIHIFIEKFSKTTNDYTSLLLSEKRDVALKNGYNAIFLPNFEVIYFFYRDNKLHSFECLVPEHKPGICTNQFKIGKSVTAMYRFPSSDIFLADLLDSRVRSFINSIEGK